ncbi:MAG TPA: hypothetical protein DD381_00855 [Lentisphaeria bacterium]|nr:MAG: hypothetical protein A2X47_00165 [Lentisphaerae bacterium GWF2_38_69]HBM14891.1 hypothetical protein [Lentisphaeria bacterium]
MKKSFIRIIAFTLIASSLTIYADDNSSLTSSDSNPDSIIDQFANMQKQIVTGEFDEPFFKNNEPAPKLTFDTSSLNDSTYPQMKYRKSSDSYNFVFVIPGFKRDNLSISVKNNTLIISGRTDYDSSSKSQTIELSEQIARKFTKTVPLPADSILSNITSKYSEGILTITVPRNPEVQLDTIHTIQIN